MSRRGVNKVILIGNLGADPELKYTPSGAAVSNFSLATNESWVDGKGERQEKTEWHRIVVWGKLAEICHEFLKKGSKIYVEGRLQTRSWDGQDGNKRYTTEVVARDVQMLDSRDAARIDECIIPRARGLSRSLPLHRPMPLLQTMMIYPSKSSPSRHPRFSRGGVGSVRFRLFSLRQL